MKRMFDRLLDAALGDSDAAIDEQIRELELAARRLEARRAALIGVSEHRGAFRVDGHRTMSAYLRAACNASDAEATRSRRIARACVAVPALGEALLAGRIGVSQVLEIARIQTNPRTRQFFERVAPIFLAMAEHDSAADLRDEIDSFVNLADQDGAYAETYCHIEQRTAAVNVVDGTLDMRATGGDALVAAEVAATFDWFVEQEFQRDAAERVELYGDAAVQHPLARTDRQRRFDAIVTMTRAARAHGDGTKPAPVVVNVVADPRTTHDVLANHGLVVTPGDGTGQGAAPGTFDDSGEDDASAPDGGRCDVVDLVDLTGADELLAEAANDPARWLDRRCQTTSGVAIHPELLLRALLTGYVRRVVVDGQGVVVDWGRRRRLFTGPAREAAKLLVRRCTHPGCTVHARVATVDHIDEWVRDFGRTDQRNADVPCDTHNRYKSQAGWRTRRDDHGRTWRIRPDGTIVLPVGARPPSFELDTMTRHLTDAGYTIVHATASTRPAEAA